MEAYPNDVRVVFKHNPLGFHPNALPAAKASMAAHMQGKFWEFHDKLFANQKGLGDAYYAQVAQELGLDMAKWEADRQSQAVLDRIQHDQKAVVSLGAGGTPAFFINGTKFSGAQPYEKFKAAVDGALSEANAELAKGTKVEDLHRVLASRNAGASFADWIIDGKPIAGAAAAPTGGRGQAQAQRPSGPPQPVRPVDVPVEADDPVRGKPDAAVTIVLFSDFQ